MKLTQQFSVKKKSNKIANVVNIISVHPYMSVTNLQFTILQEAKTQKKIDVMHQNGQLTVTTHLLFIR